MPLFDNHAPGYSTRILSFDSAHQNHEPNPAHFSSVFSVPTHNSAALVEH
jgi:hypothetical protein